MKRILSHLFISTFLIITMVVDNSFSQNFPTEKGAFLFSGNIAFNNSGGDLYEIDGERITTMSATPSLNHFIFNGFAIGGKASIARVAQGEEANTYFAVGPSFTFVVGGGKQPNEIKHTTYPYLTASFLFQSLTLNTDTESNSTGYAINFGIGLMHLLSNSIALTAEIDYELDDMKPQKGDSRKGNQINFLIGIAAFLY